MAHGQEGVQRLLALPLLVRRRHRRQQLVGLRGAPAKALGAEGAQELEVWTPESEPAGSDIRGGQVHRE